MCSILVFALADNIHPDPDLQWTKFSRGDVIDIQEDANPFYYYAGDPGLFRIVNLPGVPAAQLISLCMGDPIPNPPAPYNLRSNFINLTVLETAKNLGQFDTLTTDQSTLLAARSVKPPVVVSQVASI